MQKPRIAIIHYAGPPIIGGVETIIEAHAKLLAVHKYGVTLIVGRGAKFDPRVPIKIIPEIDSLSTVNKEINEEIDKGMISKKFDEEVKVIYKKLKKELNDIDIVIVHNVLTMHFNMPLTVALHKIIHESKIRFIAWCHDATFIDPIYKKKSIFPYNLLKKKIRNVQYVAISKSRQKRLAKLFKIKEKEITVVHDGINIQTLLKLKQLTLKIFRHFNLFKEDIVVLMPARIIKRKNLELGIRIVKEMNISGKKTKAVITGPPDPHSTDSIKYYTSLKRLVKRLKIEDKIIFLYEFKDKGKRIYVSNDMMKDLFLLSDILLFPSKREGFGIPILEAALYNIPIVCSDIEPFREIGGESDVLYIDINKKPGEITKEIIKYFNSHITVNMFKKVAREYVWESIFENKIEPLLQS